MQFNYHCPFCRVDTKHNIKGHVKEEAVDTVSEVQCSVCLGEKIYILHLTGKFPLYDSKRVSNPTDISDKGRKEVRFCGHCIKDCWGREKENPIASGTFLFTCFTCEKISVVPKKTELV